ncbi:Conserved hypothetical protein [Shewanella piezotolerans WP3]|uniref:Uncharacterized protein n=2 Tax=Shewanella TaxID=22 RepID=B8CUT0_SHEPW|nr:Conserved hypothetical protein [Shewanella piezotolerans WP3]
MTVLLLLAFGLSADLQANDKSDLAMLVDKAEEAKARSLTIEQEQLKKARDAANKTAEHEKEMLAKEKQRDWQTEQRKKAQLQFDERESREDKYLREAKEAAKLERKIPEPL